MNDLEISKALALAIGWSEDQVVDVEVKRKARKEKKHGTT